MRLVERDRPQQPGRSDVRSTLSSATSGLVMRIVGAVDAGLGQRVGRQERVRHRLGDPEPEQHLAQLPAPLLTRRQPPCMVDFGTVLPIRS